MEHDSDTPNSSSQSLNSNLLKHTPRRSGSVESNNSENQIPNEVASRLIENCGRTLKALTSTYNIANEYCELLESLVEDGYLSGSKVACSGFAAHCEVMANSAVDTAARLKALSARLMAI